MHTILTPISSCGETGIAMMSADGIWHRCHPIIAVFVGDYPEQALVTCTYNGRCSKCEVPRDRLGEYQAFPSRDPSDAIDTYRLADRNAYAFHRACREAGLKPVFHPFWESLPFADIFLSITPDILHQMLQGVMKHMIAWLTNPTVFGSAEINARCRSLPPNHSFVLLTKGLTRFSRVTGQEHKNMCRILLGLIVDLPLPSGHVPSRVVRAVRALLDFLYLAQYPSHTSETLHRLRESLTRFHDNKGIFIDLGTREDFNLPKLHSLLHYSSSIMQFGTTDNYNTEQTERLHIDFTKDAYRATNHKDEYAQMTSWLGRREKVQQQMENIKRQQQGAIAAAAAEHVTVPIGPPEAYNGSLLMALNPTIKAVSFDDLDSKYGAVEFQDALSDFIAQVNYPGASAAASRDLAADILIPFQAVPVFHKIRFVASGNTDKLDTIDAVHARPERLDLHGRVVPSRFDTVLVHNGQDRACGGGAHTTRNKGTFVHINHVLTHRSTNYFRLSDSAGPRGFPIANPGNQGGNSVPRRHPSNSPCIRRMVHPTSGSAGPYTSLVQGIQINQEWQAVHGDYPSGIDPLQCTPISPVWSNYTSSMELFYSSGALPDILCQPFCQ
jgi:hypothetical protein